jgi:hypothetical protein
MLIPTSWWQISRQYHHRKHSNSCCMRRRILIFILSDSSISHTFSTDLNITTRTRMCPYITPATFEGSNTFELTIIFPRRMGHPCVERTRRGSHNGISKVTRSIRTVTPWQRIFRPALKGLLKRIYLVDEITTWLFLLPQWPTSSLIKFQTHLES